MEFATFLRDGGIPPEDTALCLHKPGDPRTRRALAIMVAERPELFEFYQSTHGALPEATVRKRPYFASFLMTDPGELTFVGLYRREVGRRWLADDFLNDPSFAEMHSRTDAHRVGLDEHAAALAGRIRFSLVRADELGALSERLIVRDPGARLYVRLAETTPLAVVEIRRTPGIVPPMPAWDALTLSRTELAELPRDWAMRLSQWRGIYLITDEADGSRYVGAAYGVENLLGRWRDHVAAERGVTRELGRRPTARFRFSILELTAPNASVDYVTAREQGWMTRLHTKEFGLNR